MIYRQRCQHPQASIYSRFRIWQGREHQLLHFSKLGLWTESQGLFWTWVKSRAYFWPKHSCRKDATLPLARPRGHIPSRKGGSLPRVGWMDTEKPKKQLLPPQYDHKHFFCLFSNASPSLQYWVCAPPRPKYMAGMETVSAGTHRQQPCQRSWPRCRGNPPRSFIQAAIVPLRLGRLSSHGGCGREQWPAAAAVQTTGDRAVGLGERRQGRWWLLSSPRLAGPTTNCFNMTELTLLSYSEGKRKINGVKRLQHWLHEIKKVGSSLPALNAIRTTGCSVASQAPYYFHAWPPKFYQRCFICSR